jgi:nucleotide-binding universal stress UspA family protein
MSSIFSRILVGIDNSERAQSAAAFAARLVREHRGELVLCHCVRSMPQVGRSDSGGAAVEPGPDDAVLDAAAKRVTSFGIVAQRRIVEGDAANGIIRVADETACRLIVVGFNSSSSVPQPMRCFEPARSPC